MAKFRKRGEYNLGKINTSSLSGIFFMLLFFFMVTTTMKDVALKVEIRLPHATEVGKLEHKSMVSNIYIGKPLKALRSNYGSEPRIQLNDAFVTVKDIESYFAQEREALKEEDRPKMTVSIHADYDTPMGLISDVKQALRNAQVLRISYSATKGSAE